MANSKAEHDIDGDEPVLPQKESLGAFFFNRKEGTVLGRTGLSWAKIGLFYCIYYGCLAGWFAGLLHAFYSSLDKDRPTYYGNDSLILANPGLGVRPMPIADYTIIRFSANRPSSYQPYVQHLRAFFDTYDSVDDARNCSDKSEGAEGPCQVLWEDLVNEAGCGADFGYLEGTPCVVIKMNKLFGFEVDPYESYADIEKDVKDSVGKGGYKDIPAPDEANLSFMDGSGNVGISCEGQNRLDQGHMQVLGKAPANGLSSDYFPYLNQPGYRSPFVVFKLNVTRHTLVQVVCKAWAKNIDNSDGQEKRGSTHFEILID